jgi:hypothetical protein
MDVETTGATPSLSFAAVLEEFGVSWQIHCDEFAYVAVRRPTATSQEVLVGRTLDQLVEKLRAEPERA